VDVQGINNHQMVDIPIATMGSVLVHGDPCVPNMILHGEKLLWIDLMESRQASSILQCIDTEILIWAISISGTMMCWKWY